MNTLNLGGAPPISKFSKLRAPPKSNQFQKLKNHKRHLWVYMPPDLPQNTAAGKCPILQRHSQSPSVPTRDATQQVCPRVTLHNTRCHMSNNTPGRTTTNGMNTFPEDARIWILSRAGRAFRYKSRRAVSPVLRECFAKRGLLQATAREICGAGNYSANPGRCDRETQGPAITQNCARTRPRQPLKELR